MVKAVTHQQMDRMTVPELRQLLDVQIGLKAKMADEAMKLRAGVGQYTTNIHNLKAKISALAPNHKPVDVSDHSIVRYLERVKGVNIDDIRSEIDNDILRECVTRAPTGWHKINGVTYVTEHRTLVTVLIEEGEQAAPVNQGA